MWRLALSSQRHRLALPYLRVLLGSQNAVEGVIEKPCAVLAPLACHPVFPSWPLRVFSKAHKKKGAVDTNADDGPGWNIHTIKQAMEKAIDHMHQEFANLRTGRATPGMFDHLKAQVYGEKMPLKALGTSSVKDASTAAITLFDAETAPAVAKAIEESPLQLHAKIEGGEVIVHIPRPSKESIAGMIKMARSEAENAKVAVRHARKQAMDEIKKLASEDERKKAEKQVQQLTDDYVALVEKALRLKDKEVNNIL